MSTPTQAAEARRAEIARLASAWVSKRSLADAFGCDQHAEADADWAKAEFLAELSRLTAQLERLKTAAGPIVERLNVNELFNGKELSASYFLDVPAGEIRALAQATTEKREGGRE